VTHCGREFSLANVTDPTGIWLCRPVCHFRATRPAHLSTAKENSINSQREFHQNAVLSLWAKMLESISLPPSKIVFLSARPACLNQLAAQIGRILLKIGRIGAWSILEISLIYLSFFLKIHKKSGTNYRKF
jgi:hypothetical protein